MRIMYMISTIILWICIVTNIYNLLSIRKQRKQYLAAVAAANDAQQSFLEAADVYSRSAEELRAEKEHLRTLQESEENTNG